MVQYAEASTNLFLLNKIVNGFVSDDSFLYFCGWLVSQGEEIYKRAFLQPDTLVDFIPEAELMMYGLPLLPEFEAFLSFFVSESVEGQQSQVASLLNEELITELGEPTIDLKKAIKKAKKVFSLTIKRFNFDVKELREIDLYLQEQLNQSQQLKQKKQSYLKALAQRWKYQKLASQDFLSLELAVSGGNKLTELVTMPLVANQVLVYSTKYNLVEATEKLLEFYFLEKDTQRRTEIQYPVNLYGTRFDYVASNEHWVFLLGSNGTRQINADGSLAELVFSINMLNLKNMHLSEYLFTTAEIPHQEYVRLNRGYSKYYAKSGCLINGKLYFTMTYSFQIVEENYLYAFDLTTKQVVYIDQGITAISYQNQRIFYLRTHQTNVYNLYDLFEYQVETKKEVQLAAEVNFYDSDNEVLYYVRNEENQSTIYQYKDRKESVFLAELPQILMFQVYQQRIYLLNYLSNGSNGDSVAFILDLPRRELFLVGDGEQYEKVILHEDYFLSFAVDYNKKVMKQVYYYEFKELIKTWE